jgi:hypothetical protein
MGVTYGCLTLETARMSSAALPIAPINKMTAKIGLL